MTTKDYIKLAQFIGDVCLYGSGKAECVAVTNLLCTHLKRDNARFNETTFREACKVAYAFNSVRVA